VADYYFDSSALVKGYVRESGSEWVTGVLASSLNHEIFVSRITPVEIVSAISRRARDGSIKRDEARDASAAFRADLPTLYQIVELTDNVIVRAMGLSEDHALRAYDAVQLAGVHRATKKSTSLQTGDNQPCICPFPE